MSHRDIFVAFIAKAVGIRAVAKKAVELNGVRVINKATNSIVVRRAPKGIEVTDCCLEERET